MDLSAWMQKCPLIAILRGVRPAEAVAIGDALREAEIAIVEVPLNSPEPIESIRILVEQFRTEMLVGAGTVMTPDQVAQVADAGGRLIVTPHAAVDVVREAKKRGMFAAPGFFTPTEAFALLEAGADCLKLFPAEAAGPAVLQAIRAVLPAGTPVVPVGGIGADNMAPWLRAGAAGFGIGGSIFRPGDDAAAVARKAAALLAGLQAARS